MSDSALGLGGRREAREDALAVLYEADLTGDAADETLRRRDPLPPHYACEMVDGVAASATTLDEVISRHLENWTFDRLSRIDRLLARMAAWELVERPDVPTGVVLSEVVELAGQYSGAESPKFLNGVLRAVADEVRADE